MTHIWTARHDRVTRFGVRKETPPKGGISVTELTEAGVDGSQRSGNEVAFCAPERLETLTID
jgi:hypothetical protein